MSPLYALHQVTQRYGPRVVLCVPQLEIQPGEALALLGPSGAGKSSLLRLLAFLEAPTTGTLWWEGRPVRAPLALEQRRRVTLMFQRPLLLDASVERNVAYGLALRGWRDAARVRAALEQAGVGALAAARARTLSGGERQRVALARALALRPDVLLLDEPTAHLDPPNVALIERAVAELRAELGTTLVVATHNVHQARRLSERAAVLLDGALTEVGPTTCVLDNPSHAGVRAFVCGEMIY